ncbi:MAG: hypothetical protein IT561_19435, partial [Alphaproteobacteria bacterium]|nr:hypothetical protein [Alphaproteobacteria bacterium]
MNLADFRQQFPVYDDLSDAELADGLHRRFYPDLSRAAFDQQIGLGINSEPAWLGDPSAIVRGVTPALARGLSALTVGLEPPADMMAALDQLGPAAAAPPVRPPTPFDPAPAVTGSRSVLPSLTQELDVPNPIEFLPGGQSQLYALMPDHLGVPMPRASDLDVSVASLSAFGEQRAPSTLDPHWSAITGSDRRAIALGQDAGGPATPDGIISGAGDAIRSGALGLGQAATGQGAAFTANALRTLDRIDRGEAVPDSEDPVGYQYMSPQQRQEARAAVEASLGDAVWRIRDLGIEQAATPAPAALRAVGQAKTFGEAWDAFMTDPLGVIGYTGLQSAVSSSPGLVLGGAGRAVGGVRGFAAGMGLGSAGVEYASSIIDAMEDGGVNLSDSRAVAGALSDPTFMEGVRQRAASRAVPIGAMDALGARVAGTRLFHGGGRLGAAGEVGAQFGVQAGAGMAGEALGQAATGEYKPGDILLEGVAEGFTTPYELGMARFSGRSESAPPLRAEPSGLSALTVGPDGVRIEPAPLAPAFVQPEPATPVPPTPAAPVIPGPAPVPRETEQEQPVPAPVVDPAAPVDVSALPAEPISPLTPPTARPVGPDAVASQLPMPAIPVGAQPAMNVGPDPVAAVPPAPTSPAVAPQQIGTVPPAPATNVPPTPIESLPRPADTPPPAPVSTSAAVAAPTGTAVSPLSALTVGLQPTQPSAPEPAAAVPAPAASPLDLVGAPQEAAVSPGPVMAPATPRAIPAPPQEPEPPAPIEAGQQQPVAPPSSVTLPAPTTATAAPTTPARAGTPSPSTAPAPTAMPDVPPSPRPPTREARLSPGDDGPVTIIFPDELHARLFDFAGRRDPNSGPYREEMRHLFQDLKGWAAADPKAGTPFSKPQHVLGLARDYVDAVREAASASWGRDAQGRVEAPDIIDTERQADYWRRAAMRGAEPSAQFAPQPTVQSATVSQEPSPAAAPLGGRVVRSDTVTTPAGTDVPVRYAVVELDRLIPSQTDDGAPNPAFTGAQPRDRTRAASQAQIIEIAARLDPRRLDVNPSTADGAPLVGPDGMIDSGNGRVLALRRAYRQALPSSRRYREHLAAQGYPVEGMVKPVLVRINDAPAAERARIAEESNARSTLAMSATEQAMADAQKIGPMLSQWQGGEITAAANRNFVRRFVESVPSSERANVVDSQGNLSGPGIRRIQAAMLAAAYGDANLVETLIESADSDIKAIGGALVDAAPAWAQMRAEAEAGTIDPDMATYTGDLLE